MNLEKIMRIKITTDSTADLSKELYEKFSIEAIPLSVTLGEKIYQDGVDINPDMIYDYVKSAKQLPKTSAVNSELYRQKFEEIFNNGYDAIIHFNISADMSTSFQNAKNVASEMKNVFVIDSKTLSTAIGLQTIYASQLAKTEKYTPEQIVEMVSNRVDKCEASFVLDKLDYLYRGGRCNALSVLGANLLKIKPCIEVVGGKMGMTRKYIGRFDKCVLKYVKETLQKYNTPDNTRIFITHTQIDETIVNDVKKYLTQNTHFKEIYETTAGSTVTSHCGSHTIGILFFNDGEHCED